MTTLVWDETGARLDYEPLPSPKGNVIICPGGSYRFLSPREGKPVADAFARAGWQAYVLAYSVGEQLGVTPLREAEWAVRTARGLNPALPVAVCGFSAGGHLAASLAVHWNDLHLFPGGGARPDMVVLAYPVITAGEHCHRESFDRLATPETDREYFSLEQWVTAETPPTFLWHTAEDQAVPVENSFLFAAALRRHRVPFELHVYPHGAHGMSLATPEVEEVEQGRMADPHVAGWFSLCCEWFESKGNSR